MKRTKEITERQPPEKPIENLQYDLFRCFVTNDPGSVSNAIEIWENIPKYFFTAKQMSQLRTPEGLAKAYHWEYTYRGEHFKVRIQPALIEQSDGNDMAFFPGVTEELIEEALKKFFTEQNLGIHDHQNCESWVRFTLKMLHKELKERKRARSIDQIKQALKVMSQCVLTISKGGEEIYTGPILSDLVTVNRKDYIEDSSAFHMARLPVFISYCVNSLEYRQFNYARLMLCNEQLARWLYKQFVNRYKQASSVNSYHFCYLDVARNSGLLQQKAMQHNRTKLQSALNELNRKGVLRKWEAEDVREGRKIVDVHYTIFPSQEFIAEQKASNKRAKDNQAVASSSGLKTTLQTLAPKSDLLTSQGGSYNRKMW